MKIECRCSCGCGATLHVEGDQYGPARVRLAQYTGGGARHPYDTIDILPHDRRILAAALTLPQIKDDA